ncbi:hypothetical protein B0H17DRAFT_1153668 [Mycena rosella]|uniref:Uncharacterized protein n=1 Tax=Mycena rosella TaxID=1033263 RepID=A0AAD7B554_MYCRO|nr:hypothetical protein B0H17DRAFT_1153668 [Mycena rosella]
MPRPCLVSNLIAPVHLHALRALGVTWKLGKLWKHLKHHEDLFRTGWPLCKPLLEFDTVLVQNELWLPSLDSMHSPRLVKVSLTVSPAIPMVSEPYFNSMLIGALSGSTLILGSSRRGKVWEHGNLTYSILDLRRSQVVCSYIRVPIWIVCSSRGRQSLNQTIVRQGLMPSPVLWIKF